LLSKYDSDELPDKDVSGFKEVPELASLTGRSQCIWDRENQ
jgi:hypothetical protein